MVGVLLGTTYLTRSLWRRSLAGVLDTADGPYIGDTKTPSIWFEVTANNDLILYSPKVEMGQGTFTGLAQIAADELGVDINQMEASVGNVLKWNGTAWAPSTDAIGLTSISIAEGPGISVFGASPNFTVSNTGDTNPNDDLTTTSQASSMPLSL